MDPDDRLEKVEELFHAALALSPDQRDNFLSQISDSDPEIIDRVRSLLTAYERAGSFLDERPAPAEPATDAQSESLLGLEIGHFRILSLLGRGGMGEVYLAEDTKLRRKVAIKSVPLTGINQKQASKRLLREARAAACLDNPNICSVYEIREHLNRVFIIMQYVEGETLSSKLENKQLSLSQSLDVVIQIAEALAEAHRHGVIHRDIKPQNVVINPQGQVKVLDFGLAKVIESDWQAGSGGTLDSLITQENMILGTPVYMSPEQAKGEPVDSRSDIFSLGVLLFECVTGRQPFSGNSLGEIFANIINLDPQPASTFNQIIPAQLDVVLSKALAKRASARYSSASEMLEDLREVHSTLLTDAGSLRLRLRNPSPLLQKITGTVSSRLIRSNYLRIAATVALLAAVGLVIWLWPASSSQSSLEAKEWYDRGLNWMRLEAYYQATRALERAIEIDGSFALSHARLAEAWSELDYTERAKDELLIATSLIRNHEPLSQIDSLYIDALLATSRRDFAGAVDIYKKIAEMAADSEKQRAYLDLGRAYEKNEEGENALESYHQSLKYDPRYAPAFLRLGRLYGRQRDLKNAARFFDEAELIYKDMAHQECVAEVLYYRSAVFNSVDKTAEARAQLEKALKIAEILESKYQLIRTMLELSGVAYTEGNSAGAQAYATQAIDLARSNQMENLAASGLIELGNTYFVRGEYEEAKKYFRQAIEFASQSKGRRNEARARLSLGSLFIQQNNSDEGLRLVEQSLEFYEQGGYRKEAMQAHSILGRYHGQKGNYDAALHAYNQQLHLAEQMDDQSEMAFAHIGLASLLGFLQERYPEALVHSNESYRINTSIGARLNAGYDLATSGSLLWPVGRYEEALKALNQAQSIAQNPDSSDTYLMAWVDLFKSRIALSKGQLNIAREKAHKVLDLSGSQFKDTAVQAKYTLGLAEVLSGQSSRGRLLCEEAASEAAKLDNPRYTSESVLFLAEVLLAGGESRKALEKALEAQALSARFGQQVSEWQALIIAAQAAFREGDKQMAGQHSSRASQLLTELRQRWGEEAYNGFLTRPDVQKLRRHMDQLLAAGQ